MELNRDQIMWDLERLIDNAAFPDDTFRTLMGAFLLIKELTESLGRVQKQCGELIVECDERDAERLVQVAKLNAENKRLQAESDRLREDRFAPTGKSGVQE